MFTLRPLVTPGVSASTIKPVNPLNPFLMSGSVRANTKYLKNNYFYQESVSMIAKHGHTLSHTTRMHTYSPISYSTISYPHLLSINHPLKDNTDPPIHTHHYHNTHIISLLDSSCPNISHIRPSTWLCNTVSLEWKKITIISPASTYHLQLGLVLQSPFQSTSSSAHGFHPPALV